MARLDTAALTRTITADVLAHPLDLAPELARRHAVARGTIARHLRRLEALGWLRREGGARSPWQPGAQREVTHEYELAGLDEHTPWMRDALPLLALSPRAAQLAQHVYGELLNNAIDHSRGNRVTVSLRQTPTHLHLLFSDDGCGLYRQLADRAGLPDAQRAALELAKGRLSTQPDRHGGRGLFFVARMVDALDLQSDGQVLQWREHGQRVQFRVHPLRRPGTTAFVSLRLDSTLRASDVYEAHGSDAGPLDFSRTRVPLRMLTDAGTALDSRAQARWVVSRLELFAVAELDFDGVDDIGPSFIDEVFRVYARTHPEVALSTLGTGQRVERLLREAMRLAEASRTSATPVAPASPAPADPAVDPAA